MSKNVPQEPAPEPERIPDPNLVHAKETKKFGVDVIADRIKAFNKYEAVDPTDTGIEEFDDLCDQRERSIEHRLAGKIILRPNFITECITLTQEMVESRVRALATREPFAPRGLAGFMTYYSLAMQGYNTLKLDSRTNILKEMHTATNSEVFVPKFLTSLVQAIGLFNTPEGLMDIGCLEQLTLHWAKMAVYYWHSTGINDRGLRLPAVAPQNVYFQFMETDHYHNDLHDYVLTYHPDICQPVEFNSHGNRFTIDIQWRVNIDSNLALFNHQNKLHMPNANRRARSIAFLNLLNADFADWALADLNTLNILAPAQANTVPVIAADLKRCATYFKTRVEPYLRRLYVGDYFKPSPSGSTAQFCCSDSDDVNDNVSRGKHPYAISQSSLSAGSLLHPSRTVDVRPRFKISSVSDRLSLVSNLSGKSNSSVEN